MGKGNPESADTLSIQNKNQAEALGATWVALRDVDGYKRITEAFKRFDIPYTEYNGNLDSDLDEILKNILK